MYPVEEGNEDIDRERKPSRPYRLHLLTGLILTWDQQVTEVLQLKLSKISHTGQMQGCLNRRTWRFGRRFRTRTDGHTCPSVLFRWTCACKNLFTIFFFTVGNFSEADVPNLDPCWRRACADGCMRAQTSARALTRLRALADASACAHTLPPARIRLPKKWIPVGCMG